VGSVPTLLAAHAHCPVAVIRGNGESSPGPVVAGIDGGPLSDAVIEAAFEEAAHRGVPLVAVHAWSDADLDGALTEARPYFGWEPVAEAERGVLSDNLVGWPEKYPDVSVERVAVRDRPRHLLLEWSRKAQLTVVGDRGRGGFAGLLLGSTSQALIQHGHGPLLIVRQ
jgi:nucleotide-binding universal stress UspA family protein